MQRSSETIKAMPRSPRRGRAHHPEKALIATLRASNPREKDQNFRYAALSSGLDIVCIHRPDRQMRPRVSRRSC